MQNMAKRLSAPDLVKAFTSIKTLPVVALRISKLLENTSATLRDLEEVIRLDPTLVLRLMRLVNSPYYGLRQKVTDISRAVVYIGMKNLRNLIFIAALEDIFSSKRDAGPFRRESLWMHCVAVSIFAQMIAERIFGVNGEDAFLCGILHDIGIIVEEQTLKERFYRLTTEATSRPFVLIEQEQALLGTDHCEVGCCLASHWHLPENILRGIEGHHRETEEIEPESTLGMVQMADYLVSQFDYVAFADLRSTLSSPLARHINNQLLHII